jgi:hypothetical protein
MRAIGLLAPAVFILTVTAAREAKADTMDPALARFLTDESCLARALDPTTGQATGHFYNPASGYTRCGTDDVAFAKLIAQYGFAVAPTAMHSARTTGFGGFELALEGAFTDIDELAPYWVKGTEGPQDDVSKKFSIRNSKPDDLMQVYMLKMRKGFPLGFELTGNIGYVANTNIVSVGADVRWSLFEGFRTGIPAIFPELAGGGSVRTITGTEEFQLTVVGVDGQLSKPIPIAGTVILTPYVGYQWIRIFGDSGLIDLTPNTDAVNLCGYSGSNNPASKDPSKQKQDGQPICNTGTSADFNNTVVFDPVRLSRHRLNFGLQFRFQMIKVGVHFITDLMPPKDANKDAMAEITTNGTTVRENQFEDVKQQWTMAVDLGAVF